MVLGRLTLTALAVSALLWAVPTSVFAQLPDLEGDWIRGGGGVEWGDADFTVGGLERFEAYDFETDDPAYGCVGSSWTRIWLNPNVLVRITYGDDQVRLQYEWMDIDRIVPLIDTTSEEVLRRHIEGMPMLGRSAAWFDEDALVIETVDFATGYVSTMESHAGMPQSPRMHTVERITRSGNVISVETTHFDPANYRAPLVVKIPYIATDFELMEYGCTLEEASLVSPD